MEAEAALYVLPAGEIRWQEALALLPPERQRRVLTLRREEDRQRCAGAGRLLQWALAQHGVSPQEQRLTENACGRPELADRDDLWFSLSHSGPWIVCAVAAHPVGVDVELPRGNTLAVARRFFSPEEIVQLREETDFLRLWTAKEAFLKALGCGLTIPLDSFRVELRPEGAVLHQNRSELPYVLHEYPLPPGRLCLCTLGKRPPLRQVTLE